MTTQAVPSSSSSARPPSLTDFLRGALEAMRDDEEWIVVSVPAPLAPLETLLDTAASEESVLWEPAEGDTDRR